MAHTYEQIQLKQCPACGSSQFSNQHFVQKSYVEPFESVIAYDFGTCSVCGLFFVKNPLTQKSYDYYYSKAKTLRRTETDPVEREVFASQVSFMQRRRPIGQSERVLEIGCDTAQLLDHIHHAGFSETHYLELGEEAVRIIESKKIHKNYLKTPGPVDVLIIRHTLEHIVEPIHFLKDWCKKLSPTGRLFIEVPDWTALTPPTDVTNFEHVNYFALPNLSLLLDRAGYMLEDFEYKVTVGYHTSENRVLRVLAQPKQETVRDRQTATFRHLDRNLGSLYEGVRTLMKQNADKKVAFYAASWTSSDILLNAEIPKEKVMAVFDIDPRKQSQDFLGVKVLSPEKILELKPDIIVINSSYEKEIQNNLRNMGYRGELVLSSGLLKADLA